MINTEEYNYSQCPPEDSWRRIFRSATRWRSGGRVIWYLALCPHHNTCVNEIHRGTTEWPLWLTHQKWPACGAIFDAKAFLTHNSHIICRTLLKLISTCSLNSTELCGVGHDHFRDNFPLQNRDKWKTYFFALLLDDLTNLHQTVASASSFQVMFLFQL